MDYAWSKGARFGAHDPVAVGKEVDRLEKHYGSITPSILLEEARIHPSSPLHEMFDWDDSTAAQAWRIETAGNILRHLVVMVDTGKETHEIRRMINVRTEDGSVYRNVYTVMEDPVLRAQVIARAYAELESWRRRYEHLEEFGRVVSAIKATRTARPAPTTGKAAVATGVRGKVRPKTA